MNPKRKANSNSGGPAKKLSKGNSLSQPKLSSFFTSKTKTTTPTTNIANGESLTPSPENDDIKKNQNVSENISIESTSSNVQTAKKSSTIEVEIKSDDNKDLTDVSKVSEVKEEKIEKEKEEQELVSPKKIEKVQSPKKSPKKESPRKLKTPSPKKTITSGKENLKSSSNGTNNGNSGNNLLRNNGPSTSTWSSTPRPKITHFNEPPKIKSPYPGNNKKSRYL